MRKEDVKYIKISLELAAKAKGMTSPNPCVGAVVVKKGMIVGKGYHRYAGGPHAEIYALKQAGKEANGAVLYVSLEPCAHFGKTPPCTEAIARAGIKRVVAAMKDPNPLNNGKGLAALKRKGIKTGCGIMEKEARRLNEDFIKYITERMPFVTVKAAESLDGKISTRTGDSKWISSEVSRRYAHKLRSENDAVMVGAGTVIKDDPMLNVRLKGRKAKQPLRVVLAGKRKISFSSRIFKSRGGQVMVAGSKSGRADIKDVLKGLAKKGVVSVLIEGGGETIASAFEAGVVDKVCMFIAPMIIGGRTAISPVEGAGAGSIRDAVRLEDISARRIGDDIYYEGYVAK